MVYCYCPYRTTIIPHSTFLCPLNLRSSRPTQRSYNLFNKTPSTKFKPILLKPLRSSNTERSIVQFSNPDTHFVQQSETGAQLLFSEPFSQTFSVHTNIFPLFLQHCYVHSWQSLDSMRRKLD